MNYEFRELSSKDMFPMMRIISKIGVKDFKDCFGGDQILEAVNNGKVAERVGMEIAFSVVGLIVDRLPDCEEDIYKFLASVSNLKQAKIEQMSMADFAEMVITFIKKPEFGDFMRVVSRLFNQEK